MSEETDRKIRELLASAEPDDLREGLALVKKEIARLGSEESRPLFELVSTIFYIDPLDRPDLVPALDEAVSLFIVYRPFLFGPDPAGYLEQACEARLRAS